MTCMRFAELHTMAAAERRWFMIRKGRRHLMPAFDQQWLLIISIHECYNKLPLLFLTYEHSYYLNWMQFRNVIFFLLFPYIYMFFSIIIYFCVIYHLNSIMSLIFSFSIFYNFYYPAIALHYMEFAHLTDGLVFRFGTSFASLGFPIGLLTPLIFTLFYFF